jgi:creatinine amidohydrolase
MSKLFAYGELTWPEIADLPRHTPLILPLGKGYPLDQLSGIFGDPPQIGMLPAIPYGWSQNGLHIDDRILSVLITNLLDSLRDDGFINVFALTPQGVDLNLGERRVTIRSYIHNLEPIPNPPDEDRDKVVLIPVGHTEQHGYHLPLLTDTLIIDAISQRTVQSCPNLATTLPSMPYGVSTHRKSFAGTLNAGGRAFEDFWIGVIDFLVARSFNRFYFLNGHGGNSSFLVNVVKYVGEKYPWIFCATSWLYLSGPAGIAALEEKRRSGIGGMGHACELETSLMLYLEPSLVHMDRVVDEIEFIATPSYYMDWVEGGSLIANPPWDDDTRTGAYGAGSLACAENGQFWIDSAVTEKIAHIAEIHEQYNRRKEKKQTRT